MASWFIMRGMKGDLFIWPAYLGRLPNTLFLVGLIARNKPDFILPD